MSTKRNWNWGTLKKQLYLTTNWKFLIGLTALFIIILWMDTPLEIPFSWSSKIRNFNSTRHPRLSCQMNIWEFLFLGGLYRPFFGMFFLNIFSGSSQKYAMCISKRSASARRMFWIYTSHTFEPIQKKYLGKTFQKNGLQIPFPQKRNFHMGQSKSLFLFRRPS